MRGLLFAGAVAASVVVAIGCSKRTPTAPAHPGFKVPDEVTLTDGGVPEIDRAAKDTDKAVVLVEFWTMATEPSADLALAANSRGGDQQVRGKTLGKDEVAWRGVRKGEYMGMKYEGFFLRVILVNVDGAGKRDEVLKFLKDRKALHVTNIMWTGDPAAAAEKYGFTGKAPHQALFGRNGSRVWATGEPLNDQLDNLIFKELDK